MLVFLGFWLGGLLGVVSFFSWWDLVFLNFVFSFFLFYGLGFDGFFWGVTFFGGVDLMSWCLVILSLWLGGVLF